MKAFLLIQLGLTLITIAKNVQAEEEPYSRYFIDDIIDTPPIVLNWQVPYYLNMKIDTVNLPPFNVNYDVRGSLLNSLFSRVDQAPLLEGASLWPDKEIYGTKWRFVDLQMPYSLRSMTVINPPPFNGKYSMDAVPKWKSIGDPEDLVKIKENAVKATSNALKKMAYEKYKEESNSAKHDQVLGEILENIEDIAARPEVLQPEPPRPKRIRPKFITTPKPLKPEELMGVVTHDEIQEMIFANLEEANRQTLKPRQLKPESLPFQSLFAPTPFNGKTGWDAKGNPTLKWRDLLGLKIMPESDKLPPGPPPIRTDAKDLFFTQKGPDSVSTRIIIPPSSFYSENGRRGRPSWKTLPWQMPYSLHSMTVINPPPFNGKYSIDSRNSVPKWKANFGDPEDLVKIKQNTGKVINAAGKNVGLVKLKEKMKNEKHDKALGKILEKLQDIAASPAVLNHKNIPSEIAFAPPPFNDKTGWDAKGNVQPKWRSLDGLDITPEYNKLPPGPPPIRTDAKDLFLTQKGPDSVSSRGHTWSPQLVPITWPLYGSPLPEDENVAHLKLREKVINAKHDKALDKILEKLEDIAASPEVLNPTPPVPSKIWIAPPIFNDKTGVDAKGNVLPKWRDLPGLNIMPENDKLPPGPPPIRTDAKDLFLTQKGPVSVSSRFSRVGQSPFLRGPSKWSNKKIYGAKWRFVAPDQSGGFVANLPLKGGFGRNAKVPEWSTLPGPGRIPIDVFFGNKVRDFISSRIGIQPPPFYSEREKYHRGRPSWKTLPPEEAEEFPKVAELVVHAPLKDEFERDATGYPVPVWGPNTKLTPEVIRNQILAKLEEIAKRPPEVQPSTKPPPGYIKKLLLKYVTEITNEARVSQGLEPLPPKPDPPSYKFPKPYGKQ